ncbi:MAG: hypothetical protein IAE83_01155 [Anaerolinea sp.]|nr:hypothetical protein [Anaerolinea sp.]
MTRKVLTMPFSVEVLHEGRVVIFHLVDPVNLLDFKTFLQEEGTKLFDESQHPVNVVYDCLKFNRLPVDALAQGMGMSRAHVFTYTGVVVVVSAQMFLKSLTNLFVRLTRLEKVETAGSLEEALTRMEAAIKTQGYQGDSPPK